MNRYEPSLQFTITGTNLVEVIVDKKVGIKEKKYIPYEKLVEFLTIGKEKKSIKREDSKVIASTIVPAGTIYTKIFSDGSKLFYILRKASKFNMEYFGKGYKNIPVPSMIFSFKFNKGVLTGGGVAAIASRDVNNIELDTPLYIFPFTNGSSNHLCWGSNKTHIKEEKHLAALPDYFLSLPNTLHSFSASNNSLNLEFGPLLEMLEQQQEYADILLVPSKKCFGQWTGDII